MKATGRSVGGRAMISGAGLKEVVSIQKNGMTMTSPASASNPYRTALRMPFRNVNDVSIDGLPSKMASYG